MKHIHNQTGSGVDPDEVHSRECAFEPGTLLPTFIAQSFASRDPFGGAQRLYFLLGLPKLRTDHRHTFDLDST